MPDEKVCQPAASCSFGPVAAESTQDFLRAFDKPNQAQLIHHEQAVSVVVGRLYKFAAAVTRCVASVAPAMLHAVGLPTATLTSTGCNRGGGAQKHKLQNEHRPRLVHINCNTAWSQALVTRDSEHNHGVSFTASARYQSHVRNLRRPLNHTRGPLFFPSSMSFASLILVAR